VRARGVTGNIGLEHMAAMVWGFPARPPAVQMAGKQKGRRVSTRRAPRPKTQGGLGPRNGAPPEQP
jgi:hypothetical protein